jgi:hypothetical protein
LMSVMHEYAPSILFMVRSHASKMLSVIFW